MGEILLICFTDNDEIECLKLVASSKDYNTQDIIEHSDKVIFKDKPVPYHVFHSIYEKWLEISKKSFNEIDFQTLEGFGGIRYKLTVTDKIEITYKWHSSGHNRTELGELIKLIEEC